MCHKNNKQHKCDYCGKEFNRRDSFNEHVLIHIGNTTLSVSSMILHAGPRHKCPHCPKEFVQKSNLKRHIRIHLGIKPYKCQFCEMTFSDKGACNSHQRTHTGEERAACPVCEVITMLLVLCAPNSITFHDPTFVTFFLARLYSPRSRS